MLTRHERSRLTFCAKQDVTLKKRVTAAQDRIEKRDASLEEALRAATAEYETNMLELRALRSKEQQDAVV